MLYMIGIGLNDEIDITLKALDTIKTCEIIYLENYTSKLNCSLDKLEKLYGKKIILADRNLVENRAETTILKDAEQKQVAFLIIGDIFGATTHSDLVLRAKNKGIETRFLHNTSIMNAIGVTGLQLYNFGKTTSMVFFEDNWKPSTAYDVVAMNLKNNLHTLILLDIKTDDNKFMSIKQCLNQMLELEHSKKKRILNENTLVIGCAGLGSEDYIVKYGKIKDIVRQDFGQKLQCIIIPGKLHFHEQEFLEQYVLRL